MKAASRACSMNRLAISASAKEMRWREARLGSSSSRRWAARADNSGEQALAASAPTSVAQPVSVLRSKALPAQLNAAVRSPSSKCKRAETTSSRAVGVGLDSSSCLASSGCPIAMCAAASGASQAAGSAPWLRAASRCLMADSGLETTCLSPRSRTRSR